MDCETFDRDVVDLLYEDGDDDAREALSVHAASCARCGATLASLRGAREQAARLPRVAPPEGLTSRILEAEAAARGPVPLGRRVARAASWAGSVAMRPQFAMAALFCLAVGSSLLLLRARSDSVPGPTSVREEGLPSPEPEAPAAPAAAADAPPRHAARKDGAGRPDAESRRDAPREAAAEAPPASAPAATGTPETGDDADRALAAALDLLRSGGCDDARSALADVARSFTGTAAADRAARELDACKKSVPAAAAKSEPAAGPDGSAEPAAGSAAAAAKPPPVGATSPAKPAKPHAPDAP